MSSQGRKTDPATLRENVDVSKVVSRQTRGQLEYQKHAKKLTGTIMGLPNGWELAIGDGVAWFSELTKAVRSLRRASLARGRHRCASGWDLADGCPFDGAPFGFAQDHSTGQVANN